LLDEVQTQVRTGGKARIGRWGDSARACILGHRHDGLDALVWGSGSCKPFGESAKTRWTLGLTPPLPALSTRVSQNPEPAKANRDNPFLLILYLVIVYWARQPWVSPAAFFPGWGLGSGMTGCGSVLRFAGGHIGEGPGLDIRKRHLPDHRLPDRSSLGGRSSRLVSRFAHQLLAELR
jgi:hypothetical protein